MLKPLFKEKKVWSTQRLVLELVVGLVFELKLVSEFVVEFVVESVVGSSIPDGCIDYSFSLRPNQYEVLALDH